MKLLFLWTMLTPKDKAICQSERLLDTFCQSIYAIYDVCFCTIMYSNYTKHATSVLLSN